MDVYIKRRELIFFLLSVIFLGGEIGLISNILFDEYYSIHKVLFIVVISALLIITMYLIAILILKQDNQEYKTKMIFTYDMNNNKFIDIPYSTSSVNARVAFDNLPINKQDKVKKNNWRDKNPEFLKFINSTAAQIILSHFIKHRTKYYQTVNMDKLKEVLVIYKYLDVDDILGGEKFRHKNYVLKSLELTLPKGFRIDSTNDRNIRLKSKYGFINFFWDFIITTNIENSKILSQYDNLNNCIEIQLMVKLMYGYNCLKFFSKNTAELNKFIENCENEMDLFNIENSIKSYNSNVIPKLIQIIQAQLDQKDSITVDESPQK